MKRAGYASRQNLGGQSEMSCQRFNELIPGSSGLLLFAYYALRITHYVRCYYGLAVESVKFPIFNFRSNPKMITHARNNDVKILEVMKFIGGFFL